MTSPVFVVDTTALEGAVSGSIVTVSGPEGRHAVTVRRIRVGESVDLVDGAGIRATGSVAAVNGRESFDVRVDVTTREAGPQPWVTVVQALAKGDRGELAVELLTEVGVDEIVPWSAAHCVTRWRPDRAARSWQRWADAAVAAAKQSRRARFPVVAPLASTSDVAGRLRAADVGVVLHEAASSEIGSIPRIVDGSVVVVVGPEGGLDPAELAEFAEAGAQTVRLGPSVLRTSSAGMAAAAVLLSRTGRWATASHAHVPADPGVEG